MSGPLTSQNSPMLSPDTVPVARHTSQSDYRTGDLKLGRIAVLADLGRYLQVPFNCLVKCVGAGPSQPDLQRIRNNLTKCEILTDDESGLRWTDFTPPATSKESEENAFKPLGRIIAEILAEVPEHGVSFVANPNETPLSQRNNTSRPDGYLVRSNEKTEPKIHWFDIAVPFEFKKGRDVESLQDDEQKIIWSLHNIMREDPLRRFAFGITIEDTQLRLAQQLRAPCGYRTYQLFRGTQTYRVSNIDGVISLFYALGFVKELGWDPTVERILDGEVFQYKFTFGDEVFITTRELATYGADSMVGRGTRVYEAMDAEGKKVAVKDPWRDAGRQSEGEILKNIFASCAKKLQPDELANAKRHFVGVRLWESVMINDTLDMTLDPTVAEEPNRTWKWVTINPNPNLSTKPHLSSKGNVPDSGRLSAFRRTQLDIIARQDTGIPRRVHTRTVFHDVGVALKDVTSLADNLTCLSGALMGLYYLHKAGWVHHDFSVGNAIWAEGEGKLSDFEYAKEIDSDTSNDVRTGTMHFMAVEVEIQSYIFFPRAARNLDRPSFRMNFLHDIESVWWAFTWIFLYYTDTKTANADHSFDAHAQLERYHAAFPGTVGQTSRHFFFTLTGRKQFENLLTKTCFDVCGPSIPDFADALRLGYEKAEAGFPSLVLDDTLLNDMHTTAAAYLNDAQRRAGGIELCPLSNLLKQKRLRPGDETSPPPQYKGKKPRRD
ncbi:uncharacterized protein EDB93DRAFT_1110312 [Suillus bovinus]|uniref:uncharacterized protein n=1 Tax=Suillus bovinus TaxID=48563 RepID=UPI001B87DD1F|nr:uncharacterized protein EDB93DRAFT_1110312 [Suillus bovinus]KAG2125138.1 hypothetical protein EDB93DRAFT_1110312 [Suillus bovinus]